MTSMSNRVKTILNSKFISRSKIIFIGSLISQLITFGTSFVITAYFTPEDLGLLGTLTALISIVSGTLSFRFELAVIHAEREDAPNVFLQASLLSAFCSTLFCLSCFFLPWDFAKKITTYFLPFLFWTWAYFLYFNSKQLPFKFDELQRASLGSIWKSVFTLVYQMIGGWINPTFGWLLSGRVAGDYVGTWIHLKNYFKHMDWKKSTSGWKKFIQKHSDFILYMTPHHLCIALSQNILIFYLEGYGLAIVGFFALGQRLIAAPIEIIGASLFNVTTQRYAELKHDTQELRRFYSKVVLFSFSVSAFIGICIWGTVDIFIPLLGAKWLPAIPMVKNLIPYFMNTIFITPTINFLRFVDKSRLQLIVEIIELIIKISFLSFVAFSDSNNMVMMFSLLAFGLGILKTALVFRLIPKVEVK
jgi:O-antigen/teichoic acid export membrane protein